MTIYEAITNRHSVRNYEDREIEESVIDELKKEISICNQEGDLSIQLITNDKDVFKGLMAHYGGFRNVSNYIALVGPASNHLAEKLGYYGERAALKAQQLGLNTCWVAATYKKEKCRAVIKEREALICVLALGYGTTKGVPHKSKTMDILCKVNGNMPEWFQKGMEASLLAPTAMNKQNFLISLDGETVKFESTKESKYSKIDMGIIKYHFQIGADLIQKGSIKTQLIGVSEKQSAFER